VEDTYLTIVSATVGGFKDKGSKFLAFAYPVENEDQIAEIQKQLRKKYYDARHQVFAYRLGAEKKIFRASDDGEPANSSGPPVLGQIRSFNLTNVLVVVVRYFGGVKLGVPGLINAYKTAAYEALHAATVIEKHVELSVHLQFDYLQINEVMRVLKDENVHIKNQDFQLKCEMELLVKKANFQRVSEKFNLIRNLAFTLKNL